MGQRDKRHEVKQKNGSLAKLVRQQTATLSSSVRVRQEPPLMNAQVAKLVDAQDLKSCGPKIRAGSTPALGTIDMRQQLNWIECLTTDQEVVGSIPAQRAIYREVAQLGSAPGLGPGGRRFKSCLPDHLKIGAIAQLGEHLPCTQGVSGSIPLGSTN